MSRSALPLLVLAAACNGRTAATADGGILGDRACQLDYIDSSGDQRALRTFDDAGRVVHSSWSWVGGAAIEVIDWTYDHGRLIENRFATPAGVLAQVDRDTYDDRGRLIRWTEDGHRDDGQPDGVFEVDAFYRYDDGSGRLARVDYDGDGDGSPDPDDYELLTWDEAGCMTVDDSYAPTGRERDTLAYGPGCVIHRVDHDVGADGSIDGSELFRYDDAGRLVEYDGLAGDTRHYYYDDAGRLVTEQWPTATETYTYCTGHAAAAPPIDLPRLRRLPPAAER